MATRMGRLLHELGTSVLASKKDASAVNTHHIVPCLFRHLVDKAVMLGATYASIVDHTICLKNPLSHLSVPETSHAAFKNSTTLTHPISLLPSRPLGPKPPPLYQS